LDRYPVVGAAVTAPGTVKDMVATVTVPVRRLQRVVPDLVGAIRVEVEVTPGRTGGELVHRRRASCWQATGGVVETRQLVDLRPATTCDMCLRAYALPSLAGSSGAFLRALLNVLGELDTARKSEPDPADTRRTLRRRAALADRFRTLRCARETVQLSADDDARVEQILASAAHLTQQLNDALAGARAEVLAQVRAAWVGTDSPDFVVDDTPTLVGIYPYQADEWPKMMEAIVDQHTMRSDPLVLVVPRYVADWISVQTGARRHGLQLTASAAGLSPGQVDTAVHLWDPTSTGQLASLAGAAAAAHRL
jgi:hypothetical protein